MRPAPTCSPVLLVLASSTASHEGVLICRFYYGKHVTEPEESDHMHSWYKHGDSIAAALAGAGAGAASADHLPRQRTWPDSATGLQCVSLRRQRDRHDAHARAHKGSVCSRLHSRPMARRGGWARQLMLSRLRTASRYDHVGCCANETTMKQQGQALIDTGLHTLGCAAPSPVHAPPAAAVAARCGSNCTSTPDTAPILRARSTMVPTKHTPQPVHTHPSLSTHPPQRPSPNPY